jgi:hypothetical protein
MIKLSLAFLLFWTTAALAQNEFPTPVPGKTVPGVVIMCLNAQGQAVPNNQSGNCPGGSGSSTITVNSTLTSGFTAGQVLYSDGSKVQAYSVSGTGSVCMTTSCSMVTPSLGVATATSLAIGAGSAITSSGAGGALGSNAFTSTAYLPLAGGTMVGTITAADASTYGSGGISNLTFLGVGQAAPTNGIAVKESIGVTSSDGLLLTNTTAAAAGVQQWSPRIHLTGQGWKTTATAASETVDWIIENQPVQGSTTPDTYLAFSSQINGTGYINQLNYSASKEIFASAGNGFAAGGSGGGFTSIRAYMNNGFQVSSSYTFGFTGSADGTAALDTVIGRGGPANVKFGGADAVSPVNQTFSVQGSRAGTDTNVGGGTLTIASGNGTGTGTPSTIAFQVPVGTTTGTGAQTLTSALVLNGVASGGTVNAATPGSFMVGSATALTLNAGEIGMAKITASGSAPGAAGLKFEAVCGTNGGTLKIIAYAGTSTTPVTLVDNVGASATGC